MSFEEAGILSPVLLVWCSLGVHFWQSAVFFFGLSVFPST